MYASRRWIACIGVAVLGLALMAGCQHGRPFSRDLPRTPYDRYLALRGQQRPATEPDAFGVEQPALRARLQPLELP